MSIFVTVNYPFATETFNFSKRQGKLHGNLNSKELFPFLEENYGITVPDTFPKQLLEAHYRTYKTAFSIPAITIHSIVSACNEWEKYLSEKNDYISLFCHELISMAEIHTSVFSVYFSEQAGFKLIDKPLPSYALIVNRSGNVRELR